MTPRKFKKIRFVFISLLLLLMALPASALEKKLRRKEALLIAEQTPEAVAMYELKGGQFVNCINKSVMLPCETDWVTCIDDAWVVKFSFDEVCGFKSDGRMDLVIVVDAKDGHIISKYPESAYFTDAKHCINGNDCARVINQGEEECINFVYSQIDHYKFTNKPCGCQANACVLTETK